METLAAFDAGLLRWIVGVARAAALDSTMVAIGRGSVWAVPFLLLGALVVLARRDGRAVMALWRLALAVVLASVVAVDVLKPAFERARPFEAHPDIRVVGTPSRGSSMPSGHAATAVAGAVGLALLWPGGRALAWTLAAVILFSRLYLGVHYPSDVIVGGLVGLGCAYFATAGTRADPRAPAVPSLSGP